MAMGTRESESRRAKAHNEILLLAQTSRPMELASMNERTQRDSGRVDRHLVVGAMPMSIRAPRGHFSLSTA